MSSILFFILILIPDNTICSYIVENKKFDYTEYFYPEFKDLYNSDTQVLISSKTKEQVLNNFEEFDRKRTIGENDYILWYHLLLLTNMSPSPHH